MKSKKIIIGSRGSKLALIYAERAKAKISEFFNEVEISMIDVKKTIVKAGDEIILIPAIHGGNVII